MKRPYIIHKQSLLMDKGKSVAEREDWENNLPEFIKLALPAPGRVVCVFQRGTDKAEKLEIR
jgi:hypothetical protein